RGSRASLPTRRSSDLVGIMELSGGQGLTRRNHFVAGSKHGHGQRFENRNFREAQGSKETQVLRLQATSARQHLLAGAQVVPLGRSEEHTSELQSRENL